MNNIKKILLGSAVVIIGLIGLIGSSMSAPLLRDDGAQIILMESPEFSSDFYLRLDLESIEYIYLRLKVDWEDKDDVTRRAQHACTTLSDREKIECYREQRYFDKKQTSKAALDTFVEFKREHKVR